jgi:benzylsuccinate CoA-transferase BbsF subunit
MPTPVMPLSGIRVADFSWVVAGPWCTRHLALMGAEVIKIESQKRIDFCRMTGPFPNGVKNINTSGYFNMWNQSKKSCSINLADPKGRDIARRLVKVCDVVVENFASGSVEKMGFSYAELKKIRPDLIMLSSSGFGRTGPEKDWRAYGRNLQAASGLYHLTGFPGGSKGTGIVLADAITGLINVFAILAAIHHRNRTGEGQYIDVSMIEATAAHIPESVMDYAINGRNRGCRGNRSETMAPHNAYRCLGEDKWVAIEVNDEQWPDFCRAIGEPEWCRNPKFSDVLGRLAHEDELDRRIGEWTSRRTVEEAVSILQRHGIAAGASADLKDLFADASLYDQGALVKLAHPEAGVRVGPGLPWQMSRVTPDYRRAPNLGEDNSYVFCELLGMTENEVNQLAQEGILV